VSAATTDLARRLNGATVHMVRALRRANQRSALADEHRAALGIVVHGGPIRIGDLARTEGVGAPAMNKTVAALERARLVRKARDPRDARAVLIQATAAGTRLVRHGIDARVHRITRALDALPTAERKEVARAIDAIEDVVRALEREERP
jgi:DNA-binding MarR family transcriptional regulator